MAPLSAAQSALDAEMVLLPVLAQLDDGVFGPADGRMADLGCGPGCGTVALAERFPEATVVGLDWADDVLTAGRARAEARGVSDRVTFVSGDLDSELSAVDGPVDLVMASMSLHHVSDIPAAAARAVTMLVPGGRLLIIEHGQPVSCRPASPALATTGHSSHKLADAEWLQLLTDAGLTDVGQAEHRVGYGAPLDDRVRSWLVGHFRRRLELGRHNLDADQVAAIAELADDTSPTGVARSDELSAEVTRMVHQGQKPA